jgi:recombination associated protein RdgC
MWFKNLAIYRLPADWSLSAAALEEQLGRHPLQPCSPLQMMSRGWVVPATTERLLHTVNGQHLLALGVEQKLLPASIIREETAKRAKELAQSQGFPAGKRQLRDLKMRVTEELRSRALSKRRTTRAWIDPGNGWFVVDAASPGRAEEVIETLRDTLGSFAVLALDTVRTPHTSMAAWLTHGAAPGRFTLEEELELQAPNEAKSTVRYTRHPLDIREIRAHLSAGKYPTRLGLTWSERIAFLLTDKLQVKRLQFLELQKEDSGDGQEVDPAEQLDIDFTVMTGELAKLLADLVDVLGGEERQAAAA